MPLEPTAHTDEVSTSSGPLSQEDCPAFERGTFVRLRGRHRRGSAPMFICIGEGGQNTNVSMWVSQTELGRYKTEKERESECGARIKIV